MYVKHTNQVLYYTKLQLLLFYYEREYFQQYYGEKILNKDFLYNGYIPTLEGLEELLEVLNLKQIIKFADSEYGRYV